MLRQIVPHTQSYSYNAALPNRNTLSNDRSTANKTACSNAHIAIKDGAGGDVAVVLDCRVMLKQRTRIDDAVVAHPGASIDDGAMHHDRARAQCCMTGNISTWCNDCWQLKPKCYDLLV